MSLGKVTVWKMTEEERLAYIAKHPIVPTEKPTGAAFSNISELQHKKARDSSEQTRNQKPKVMDHVDTEKLRKLFLAGEKLDYIASALKISTSSLNNYIKEQRQIEPEKWPHRVKKTKK